MATFPYKYEPLRDPGRQIRLMTLLPARNGNSTIRLLLSTYDLPLAYNGMQRLRKSLSFRHFWAVSYVWGSETRRSTYVLVNGVPFPVSQNVEDALRAFRAYASIPVSYWMDYICINQDDNAEKSLQIPLMPHIYSSCMLVMVWLGHPTPDSDRATTYISKLIFDPVVMDLIKLFEVDFSGRDATLAANLSFGNTMKRIIGKELVWYTYAIILKSVLWIYGSMVVCVLIWMTVRAMWTAKENRIPPSRICYAVKSTEDFKRIARGTVRIVPEKRIEQQHTNAEERQKPADGSVKVPTCNAITPPHTTKVSSTSSKTWTPSAASLHSVASDDSLELANLLHDTLFRDTHYFQRMWTLQEACMNASSGIAHGTMMVSISDVFKVVSYLDRTLGHRTPNFDKIVRLQWISAEFFAGRRIPLQVLLYETRDRYCGDLRDKIYALRGLMYEHPTILVEPNYDKPVAEVYANATRFLIASNKSLDIICCYDKSQSSIDVQGLPSWSPDFSRFGIEDRYTLMDLSGRESRYKTSSNEPLPETPDLHTLAADWKRLKVSCIRLGVINRLSDHSAQGATTASMSMQWMKFMDEHYRSIVGATEAFSRISQLFKLLSKEDQPKHGHQDLPSFRNESEEHLKNLESLTAEGAQLRRLCNSYLNTIFCNRKGNDQSVYEFVRESMVSTAIGEAAHESFDSTILRSMSRRRLFLGDGGLFGAAPHNTELGDGLFVLLGCTVPVVLHRSDESGDYQLIGECYCEELMEGTILSQTAIRENIWLR